MAERFEKLFSLSPNLYVDGSPVVLTAGALLKDTQTGSVITQLKFLSVSNQKIIALKIAINAFDISGNLLNKVDEYQYLDLDIRNGDFFGENKAIVMPENITRTIKIRKITVVHENGEYSIDGAELAPMEQQERLSATLNRELLEQYRMDANTSGEFVPRSINHLWLCACQTPNAKNTCAKCGAKKDAVFGALDIEELRNRLGVRREQQNRIAEEEKLRIEAEEAASIQKKQKYKKLGLLAVFLIVAIIGINAIVNHISYQNILKSIDSYIAEEEYELAFDLIHTGDITYDDRCEYRDKVIPLMREQHTEWRNSSNENLACVVGGTEYCISKKKIYTMKDGEVQETLYTVSASEGYLRPHWSVYANGYLFFVEGRDLSKGNKFIAQYINLETGEVEILGTSTSRGDIVKLWNGCVFIGQELLDFHDGIYYNPYTHSEYSGDEVISDSELESAVYSDF